MGSAAGSPQALANEDRINAIIERARDQDRDELIRYGRADIADRPIGAAAARRSGPLTGLDTILSRFYPNNLPRLR